MVRAVSGEEQRGPRQRVQVVERAEAPASSASVLGGAELFDLALATTHKLALGIDVAIETIAGMLNLAGDDREALGGLMLAAVREDPRYVRHGNIYLASDRSGVARRAQEAREKLAHLEAELIAADPAASDGRVLGRRVLGRLLAPDRR